MAVHVVAVVGSRVTSIGRSLRVQLRDKEDDIKLSLSLEAWIEIYTASNNEGIIQLLNFLVQASGLYGVSISLDMADSNSEVCVAMPSINALLLPSLAVRWCLSGNMSSAPPIRTSAFSAGFLSGKLNNYCRVDDSLLCDDKSGLMSPVNPTSHFGYMRLRRSPWMTSSTTTRLRSSSQKRRSATNSSNLTH